MSLYLEQISQLVDLQRVDDSIFAVNSELKAAPQEVDELSARFKVQEDARNRILDKIQHLTEQQKRLDSEMEDETSRMHKSRSKLMQVGNSREYQAMMREMDSMERSSRGHVDERNVLADELTLQQSNIKEVEETWNTLKAELETKQANLEKRLAEANQRLASLEKVRSNAGSAVPRPVLARYEFIRRRLEHPVIVPVDEGVCSGCHISIPPQVYIELQRGQQIMSCPNCQRLIYWTNHFHDHTQEAKAAPKKATAKEVDKDEE